MYTSPSSDSWNPSSTTIPPKAPSSLHPKLYTSPLSVNTSVCSPPNARAPTSIPLNPTTTRGE
eukprot:CCRYP_013805-RH/>CCRYP_013805-RH protein AED:0.45 eAED:0.48 QI:0/0/0.5/1/0/0/2/278/62